MMSMTTYFYKICTQNIFFVFLSIDVICRQPLTEQFFEILIQFKILYSAFYDTIVAKQLHMQLSF